jgi:tellurite methyltransferase
MSNFDREKWDAKYSDPANAPTEPSATLLSLASYLPQSGRALEIAGGGGRNSIWLARRGLDVTIADVSSVGLALASQRAAAAGVKLTTLPIDLEQQPLPTGPFDLILSICYFCPHLFPQFPNLLTDSGILVVIQPTKKNLELCDKPPAPFLFESDQLAALARKLEIIHYHEGPSPDNRHDAILVAKKTSQPIV